MTELRRGLLLTLLFLNLLLLSACNGANSNVNRATADVKPGPEDPFATPALCPTDSGNVNSGRFGCSRSNGQKWHSGTDLKSTVGKSFASVYPGQISHIVNLAPTDPKYDKGLGNYIIVRSDNVAGKGSFSMRYAHLESIDSGLLALCDPAPLPDEPKCRKPKPAVTAGQAIGTTGESGNSSEVINKHLHIEVSLNHFANAERKNFADPENYLKALVPKPSANPASPNPDNCKAPVPLEIEDAILHGRPAIQ